MNRFPLTELLDAPNLRERAAHAIHEALAGEKLIREEAPRHELERVFTDWDDMHEPEDPRPRAQQLAEEALRPLNQELRTHRPSVIVEDELADFGQKDRCKYCGALVGRAPLVYRKISGQVTLHASVAWNGEICIVIMPVAEGAKLPQTDTLGIERHMLTDHPGSREAGRLQRKLEIFMAENAS